MHEAAHMDPVQQQKLLATVSVCLFIMLRKERTKGNSALPSRFLEDQLDDG